MSCGIRECWDGRGGQMQRRRRAKGCPASGGAKRLRERRKDVTAYLVLVCVASNKNVDVHLALEVRETLGVAPRHHLVTVAEADSTRPEPYHNTNMDWRPAWTQGCKKDTTGCEENIKDACAGQQTICPVLSKEERREILHKRPNTQDNKAVTRT
jgi:hypothetical protein